MIENLASEPNVMEQHLTFDNQAKQFVMFYLLDETILLKHLQLEA
jgi:hypothetical protein